MAPAANARAVMSSHGSSACWPTSTASATTSAPHSSWIHFTATDVSSPPEYASTTRFAIVRFFLSLETSQAGELAGHFGTAGGFGAHQDDRVVARHRAQDIGESGAVE